MGGHSHTHTRTPMLMNCARIHKRPITFPASRRELITEEQKQKGDFLLYISVFFKLHVGAGTH